MNLMNDIKCIMCLVKCSKYLYFAKKVLCFITILIAAAMLLKFAASDARELTKKFGGMM